jgi:hypothetical protein
MPRTPRRWINASRSGVEAPVWPDLALVDNALRLHEDSDAVNDDILKNQVRCRVETRAGVSVTQPGACVKIATAA